MSAQQGSRAFNSIKDRLASGYWARGDRLPPLIELAQLCSVSRSTMWRALTMLQKESLLHTRKGRPIIAGPDDGAVVIAPHRGRAWQRAKAQIGRDILSGAFHDTRLPPTTKLARQYGVAIDTCKKSLRQLVAEGILVNEGRGFSRPHGRLSMYPPTIVLFAEKGSLASDQRSREVAICVERECVRIGYSCRIVGVDTRHAAGVLEAATDVAGQQNVRGRIFTIWNPWEQEFRNRWIELIGVVGRKNIPTIIIDQAGNFPATDALRRLRDTRVLRIAGERAGEMVGEALIKRGHRQFAYITGAADADWSQNRYDGLCRQIRQYGGPKAQVFLITFEQLSDPRERTLALMGLTKQEIRLLFKEHSSESEIRALQAQTEQVLKMAPDHAVSHDAASQTIKLMARSRVTMARRKHDPGLYDWELANLMHAASEKAIDVFLWPLLQKSLKGNTATAWVFAEDKMALSAVTWLQSAGIKVPNDISVIGFDNWRENVEHQLSSYDFDMNGMVREAMLLILDSKYLKGKPAISEMDGYVVERRTTRR